MLQSGSGTFTLQRRTTDERRAGSASRLPLKEKFVDIYEAFFQGQNPSRDNPHFWEELLLLKVNAVFLETCVKDTTEDQLLVLKANVSLIFENCVRMLHDGTKIRVLHALQTLQILLRGLFEKKFTNFGFDIINLLTGVDKADEIFGDLIQTVCELMAEENTHQALRTLALNLLLSIATAATNIHQNTLIEYFMINYETVFDSLVQLLVSERMGYYSFNAVFLLVTLVNYRKYESKNPYMRLLGELKDKKAFEAFDDVIASVCEECNAHYASAMGVRAPGWLGYIADFLATKPANGAYSGSPNSTGAVLLAFYELVYLNRQAFVGSLLSNAAKQSATKGEKKDTPAVATTAGAKPPAEDVPSLPLTLKQFIIFCSYIFQDMKDLRSMYYAKLSLITLCCLFEDDTVNEMFHSDQLLCVIPYYQQKKATPESLKERPVLATILDVLLLFMRQNLKKKLPSDLYCKCLETIRRILCYEKKKELRFNYRWKELWATMFKLMRFISTPEYFEKPETLVLAAEITTVFNLFITYGDLFLPQPSDYDDLYYELIRDAKAIETFYYYVDRYDRAGTAQNLENMNTIIRHFTSKIDQWEAANAQNFISTPAQVMELIRTNYETLKLTLQDDLDSYDAYLENPREVPFFRQLIRTIVADYRSVVDLSFTPPPPEEILSAASNGSGGGATPKQDKGKERLK
jgi:hypothetical protein